MYIVLHVKYPLFYSDFKEPRNFLDRFSINIQISNFMKTRAAGAFFSMQTKGWTDVHRDMTKLIVAFRNFTNAHKIIRDTLLEMYPFPL